MTRPTGTRLIASNRRARHDYAILDTVEAGLVLTGSEVKSLREAKVQLADAFARFEDGECWLEGVHITPWAFAGGAAMVNPDRRRKLLLHRDELEELRDRVQRERLTLVPLSMYFKDGRAKVDLAVAKGRRHEDKRQAIAERDAVREAERELGRKRKGRL